MNNLRAVLEQNNIDASSLNALGESEAGFVYNLETSGKQAIALWEKLRALVPQTRHWPILVGDKKVIALFQEQLEGEDSEESTSELIRKGLALDAAAWLQEREEQRKADYEDDDIWPEVEEWPQNVEASNEFSLLLSLTTRKPLKTVYLALVPTQNFWEVPAIVRFGGWNECPAPAEHVSIMRHWNEKYSAELVALSGDTMEMKVTKPPTEREDALELAREQFIYCDDIVTQGTQSIERLAASLIGGTVWFFWWD